MPRHRSNRPRPGAPDNGTRGARTPQLDRFGRDLTEAAAAAASSTR